MLRTSFSLDPTHTTHPGPYRIDCGLHWQTVVLRHNPHCDCERVCVCVWSPDRPGLGPGVKENRGGSGAPSRTGPAAQGTSKELTGRLPPLHPTTPTGASSFASPGPSSSLTNRKVAHCALAFSLLPSMGIWLASRRISQATSASISIIITLEGNRDAANLGTLADGPLL